MIHQQMHQQITSSKTTPLKSVCVDHDSYFKLKDTRFFCPWVLDEVQRQNPRSSCLLLLRTEWCFFVPTGILLYTMLYFVSETETKHSVFGVGLVIFEINVGEFSSSSEFWSLG